MSLANGYFPEVRYQNKHKMLWDPIWKRTLTVRPEECVRLQWIDVLLHSGWSRNRISTELPVDDPTAKSKLRADLLCYDENLDPKLLIECKAPSVPLKQLTGEQAGRYNQHIGAPYILLTNGRQDLWFHIDHNKNGLATRAITCETVLAPLQPNKDYEYWAKRGFLSQDQKNEKHRHALKSWLQLWQSDKSDNQPKTWSYLNFPQLPAYLPSHHYYRMYSQTKTRQWAFTFIRGFDDRTNFVAALNEDGILKGLLHLNWDNPTKEDLQPQIAQLYLPSGTIGVSDPDHLHLISQWQAAESVAGFADALQSLFQTYQITG